MNADLTNMNADLIGFKTTINPEVLAREIVVTSKEEHAYWGDVLKLCKSKIKEVQDERKSYTIPLDLTKEKLMQKEHAICDPIRGYMEKVEKAMGDWFLKAEKERAAEQKRLEQEAIKNTPPEAFDVVVPVVESVKSVKGRLSTSTAVKYNEYEVANEALVPREYLKIDDSKISYAINKGGLKEIPGIKIIQKVRFNSR